MEFICDGSSSLGEDGYIFFNILDSGYCSNKEFRFWASDLYGNWVNDDSQLPTYPLNIGKYAEDYVALLRERSSWYKHDQLLTMFGCDFAHTNAYQSVVQMEKIMKYINSNSTLNITIKWSTLADYVQSVNALNLTWKLEQTDFFPYIDRPHGVFSGISVHTKLQ